MPRTPKSASQRRYPRAMLCSAPGHGHIGRMNDPRRKPRLMSGLILITAVSCTQPQPTVDFDPDVVITNALLLDGTGTSPQRGGVRIRGDRIMSVGVVNP